MKTLSIEIADNVYQQLLNVLKVLPKDSFVLIEEDADEPTAEESKEIYRLKKKADKGDYSEFEDWDKIKGKL
jgi:hypothetical protein